jgi:hypothetical protein
MNGRREEGNENTSKILPHKDSICIYIHINGKEVKTMGSIIKTPS